MRQVHTFPLTNVFGSCTVSLLTTTTCPTPPITPRDLLDPEVVSRLLTAALTVLEDVARTSTNPIERRRAATTILRYLFAPAARAPRTPSPTNASPGTRTKLPAGERSPTIQASRTPHPVTADSTPLPPAPAPSQPIPQLRSAPPLRRMSHTPSPAASLLNAFVTSHDVARQRPGSPQNSEWRCSTVQPLIHGTLVHARDHLTTHANAPPTALPPPQDPSTDAQSREYREPLRSAA